MVFLLLENMLEMMMAGNTVGTLAYVLTNLPDKDRKLTGGNGIAAVIIEGYIVLMQL